MCLKKPRKPSPKQSSKLTVTDRIRIELALLSAGVCADECPLSPSGHHIRRSFAGRADTAINRPNAGSTG